MIIPTGIGCAIGGHAGDATPAAKLLGSCCDKIILNPNVVNASDINEMPPNALYVEGSIIDRFLDGSIELKEVSQNRILVAVNSPVQPETINAVSAARSTIGADIKIVELTTPLRMIGKFQNGIATGEVTGWEELVTKVWQYEFDALAITTPIEVDRESKLHYFRNGGINLWGKVEAMASKLVALQLNKPVAHSPVENTPREDEEVYFFNEVVDPRLSAEMVSVSYLHCILKGLHKAPRPSTYAEGIGVESVDFLVTPANCVGAAHHYAMRNRVKIIAVKENKTCLKDKMPDEFIVVENYLEACGIIMAEKAGIDRRSVRRPLNKTKILK